MSNKQTIKNESFLLIANLKKRGIELNLTAEQLSEYIFDKVVKNRHIPFHRSARGVAEALIHFAKIARKAKRIIK